MEQQLLILDHHLESFRTNSKTYGYFGGGYTLPAGRVSAITRLDFSTENLSAPGKNLPAARTRISAVSNSN